MSKSHLLVLIIVSIFTCAPLFSSGYFTSQDGEHHLVRTAHFYNLLISGHPIPRWADGLNQGLGYPVFNFVYPLPYYLNSVWHSLGVNIVTSQKLTILLATILSSVGFYYWTKSLPASLLYIFVPYRFLDMYVRSSLGEIVFIGIIPWVFYAVKNKKATALTIFYSLCLLSHLQLSLLFLSPLIIYILMNSQRIRLILSIVFSLLLTAFHWLPSSTLIGQTKFLLINQFPPADHLVTFKQLLYSPWGFGFSFPGPVDGMSFQLGIAGWIVLSISILTFFKQNRISRLMLIVCLISIFAITNPLFGLWNIAIFKTVQFPWRLLIIPSFFLPFIMSQLKLHRIFLVVLVIVSIYTNRNHIRINLTQYQDTPDSYFLSFQGTSTATPDELMPLVYNFGTKKLFTQSLPIKAGESISLLTLITLTVYLLLEYRHRIYAVSRSNS